MGLGGKVGLPPHTGSCMQISGGVRVYKTDLHGFMSPRVQ